MELMESNSTISKKQYKISNNMFHNINKFINMKENVYMMIDYNKITSINQKFNFNTKFYNK